MTTEIRRIKETLDQGINEAIPYILDTTPWGGSPSSASLKLYDITAGVYTDVTATMTTGAINIVGNNITLPAIWHLVESHIYRMVVQFVCGGKTFEAWGLLTATK